MKTPDDTNLMRLTRLQLNFVSMVKKLYKVDDPIFDDPNRSCATRRVLKTRETINDLRKFPIRK